MLLTVGLFIGSLQGTVDAQAGLSPLQPVLIEGDADLCNVADVTGGQDVPDGIINCNEADGSAEAPYVIRGWNITWDPAEGCRIAPAAGVCTRLPPCSLTTVPAALAICGTRKHLRIEDSEIWNAEIAREVGPDQNVRIPAAAVLASNVDNLALSGLTARGAGVSLFIEAGKPVPTLAAPGSTPLIIADLDARAWYEKAEGALLGPLNLDETVTNIPELSIVRIADVSVELRHVNIDAFSRQTGIDANASTTATRFILRDSVVANASTGFGVDLLNGDSVIERNLFSLNGAPSQSGPEIPNQATASGLETGSLKIVGGTSRVAQNRFELRGAGIFMDRDVTGQLRENTFVPVPAPAGPEESLALWQDSNGRCTFKFHYNELPGSSVRNGAADCAVDARYNWWAGAPATLGEGSTATEPQLSGPLADLPVVRIDGPANGTQVHGQVFIQGTVGADSDFAVKRVEGSAHESDWIDNRSAAVGLSWALTWDLAGEPLGTLTLYFRACGQGDDCGLPTPVDVLVIEKPLPPIALLQAEPRIATTNQPILLDASFSYSPQERPLRAFRFDLGTGVLTEWQTSPLYETSYSLPGEYAVSVQVQDVQGLISENLPQTLIRVQEAADANNGTPWPPVLATPVVLIAVAWLRRRTG